MKLPATPRAARSKYTSPMPTKRPDRGLDFAQNAFRIVQESTGQRPKSPPPGQPELGKDPAAVSLGMRGGRKGGLARAAKLSAKRRGAIARKAARARWKKP